ncbi:MAG: CBS domain-containing protein [Pseudomonadota bacterium]|nr:MAG: CBS domain-containing protein [Pseudomonadota bacterium]
MNDDKPSPESTTVEESSAPSRSLLDRISQALLGEPGTREELTIILREAQSRDIIARDVLDMMEGVLATAEMKVRDIMIPRAQMDVVDKDAAPETYLPMVIESGHSRYPMVDGDKDKVIGILLAKDLLRYFQLDKKKRAKFSLQDMLRPAVFVPESKRLNVLLREFRSARNHMALVVDEYGGVAGLVTIEDVLEQIVGDIRDEYDIDGEDTMIAEIASGEFVVKALTPLEDFNARFQTTYARDGVETIGGYVMAVAGRVPRRSEKFDVDGLRVEVLRADSRRLHLLKVTHVAPASGEATA